MSQNAHEGKGRGGFDPIGIPGVAIDGDHVDLGRAWLSKKALRKIDCEYQRAFRCFPIDRPDHDASPTPPGPRTTHAPRSRVGGRSGGEAPAAICVEILEACQVRHDGNYDDATRYH